MFDIVSIGTATRDAFFIGVPFVEVDGKQFSTEKGVCLSYGSKVEVPEIVFTSGGAGTNAAVTFARHGLRVAGISRVGNDVSGKTIIEELRKENVNADYFQFDSQYATAYSVIFLTAEGERTILSYKGAGKDFSEKEILWEALKGTKWFYLDSLAGNETLLRQLLDFAKKNNIKVAANPGAKELAILKQHPDLLASYDIFSLNQEEASDLTGVPYAEEKNIFSKLDALVNGIVVMTKGPGGAVVSDGRVRYRAGIFPDQHVLDRTGAGDAFASGFVSSFVREGDIAKAIICASANATSVVETVGAKEGILTLAGLENERWKKLDIVSEKI